MKKSFILVAAMALVSACGFLRNTTVSADNGSSNQTTAQTQTQTQSQTTTTTTASTQNNAAQTAGQGAGGALLNLYNQYKADGNKYDYKNMQNILNTVTLVANCEGLKENYKNTSYLSEFSKGMIASSLGLVNQNNAESVTNSLVDMIKANENVQNASNKAQSTANTAAGYANTATQYATSIGSLLSIFGGNK